MRSLSADDLYELAGIDPTGATPWGEDIPSREPGVYVISIDDLATVRLVFPDRPPLILEKAAERSALWQNDQEIVYIGRAQQLQRRLQQFRKHLYGNPSPHRGGQDILLLDAPKTVRWAVASDFADAEHRLIEAFRAYAGRIPFGNRVRSARVRNNSDGPPRNMSGV